MKIYVDRRVGRLTANDLIEQRPIIQATKTPRAQEATVRSDEAKLLGKLARVDPRSRRQQFTPTIASCLRTTAVFARGSLAISSKAAVLEIKFSSTAAILVERHCCVARHNFVRTWSHGFLVSILLSISICSCPSISIHSGTSFIVAVNCYELCNLSIIYSRSSWSTGHSSSLGTMLLLFNVAVPLVEVIVAAVLVWKHIEFQNILVYT